MKPSLPAWLVGLVVMAGGVGTTYVTCPGCIDRSRVNNACEWTGDVVFPIDPQNPAHRVHLVGDAQLAEELAIRYADAEHGRRFGVEHHGGLLEGGRVRNGCLSRMLRAIEVNHQVSAAAVQAARGGRNWIFDAAVSVLFVPLYVLGGIVAGRWVSRRFAADGRLVRWVATALMSVPIGFVGLQCLRLWAAVWEVVRVGNGHMTSIRAASQSRWMHHVDGQLLGAAVLFCLIALWCSRSLLSGGDTDARNKI
jgi:hypothetical protein